MRAALILLAFAAVFVVANPDADKKKKKAKTPAADAPATDAAPLLHCWNNGGWRSKAKCRILAGDYIAGQVIMKGTYGTRLCVSSPNQIPPSAVSFRNPSTRLCKIRAATPV
ncbi:hypothetical protein BDN71DRAFT_1508170 [Pleurotus eryngii]|uniref:Uncharacterized protein n=1 Tax=Pleurotus eryngii TaxID=5323 RepID=A0A9P6D5T1_PLEER|nr:hypothetical protein BDN71DRAFT_1508170 [Pleurotus eryngii]